MSRATRRIRANPAVPFVRRVRVRNFRSIADCDVTLGPLTVLVGFNASGKSNFVDALKLVADAMRTSLVNAVSDRGGLDTLLHRGTGGVADSFEIMLDLVLSEGSQALYGFTVGPDPEGELPLLVRGELVMLGRHDGELARPPLRQERSSRLRLPSLFSSDDEVLAILEASLRAMTFYDLDSEILAGLYEPPPAIPVLGSAGEYLGPVLGAITRDDPLGKERLDAYLGALVPNALRVDERREGRYSTVQADFHGDETFQRESLSEGTLRAAGVLAALSQPAISAGRISLVAIEEPETAFHPSGVGALYEALDDAAERVQVIVTSQSSDLLDNEYARLDHIRVVSNEDGRTRIGEVDAAGRAIVEKGLMSLSELHRSGQLRPAEAER